MPIATSGRTKIHYTIVGDATKSAPVVLLHGFGLSSRFWFDIPRLLATDPKMPRRVIAIDNRGTGKSDQPNGLWSVQTMADDVVAVLDHIGEKDAIVVGLSMGGMIAQQVALRHPSRVRGLVLLASAPGFIPGALPEMMAIVRLFSLPLGGRRAARNFARLLLAKSKWHRAHEILREWPKAFRDDRLRPQTFRAHLFAASTHFVGRRLSHVACPVIVVGGEHDSLLPVRNSVVLARLIPGAELEIVPDGHVVYADDPDLVRRMVERIEARVSIPRPADAVATAV